MKPISVQCGLSSKVCNVQYVVVHPLVPTEAWGFSSFNKNGGWRSTSVGDYKWTKEEAQKAAANHRKRLRKIHKQNVAKWAKK